MQGALVVVSGFSGTGKGSVMKKLLSEKEGYALSVSATTRAPREGEVHGREYFFVSREEFDRMVKDGELLEHATYVGNSYGTPASYVFEQMNAGKNVLLEIEIQGALNVKKAYPKAVLIFLIPPSARELVRRLKGRGTETEDVIRERLRRTAEEAKVISRYDYVVVNDDLETCVDEVDTLIQMMKLRSFHHEETVEKIKNDLLEIAEGEEL